MSPRILVAGIGNIFYGDDAFGAEVVQRLAARPQRDGVQVAEFGIRGVDLAYALLDDYDSVIWIDTVARGDTPGTLSVIEPDAVNQRPSLGAIPTHNVDPVAVLALVQTMGGQPPPLYLIGCEPATFGDPDGGQLGLSGPVAAAVDRAVELTEALIDRLHREPAPGRLGAVGPQTVHGRRDAT